MSVINLTKSLGVPSTFLSLSLVLLVSRTIGMIAQRAVVYVGNKFEASSLKYRCSLSLTRRKSCVVMVHGVELLFSLDEVETLSLRCFFYGRRHQFLGYREKYPFHVSSSKNLRRRNRRVSLAVVSVSTSITMSLLKILVKILVNDFRKCYSPFLFTLILRYNGILQYIDKPTFLLLCSL